MLEMPDVKEKLLKVKARSRRRPRPREFDAINRDDTERYGKILRGRGHHAAVTSGQRPTLAFPPDVMRLEASPQWG